MANKKKRSKEKHLGGGSPKKFKLEKVHHKDEEPKIEPHLEELEHVVGLDEPHDQVLDWESDDLTNLINNVAKCLPKNDFGKYKTSIEKLDWEKIKFGNYTADECKEKWNQITLKLRRYRTLTELVGDAKIWLKTPWQTYNNSKKIRHPDYPKRPLTPFFRYFMEKREKSGKTHPGQSVTDLAKLLSVKFHALPEKKKQKYKEAYEREYEEYREKLQKFKIDHPEIEVGAMSKHQLSQKQEGPAKPHTPFQLFFVEKVKKEPKENHTKKETHEKIKGMWNELSEGKKIKWIRRALADEQRYLNDLNEYSAEHPNFEPTKLKSVLNKTEKELKDRFDGKPEKPPNSGYSLFSKIMLRNLKDVPSKEKMVVIAKRWKEKTDAQRETYNKEAQKAMSKYIEKFEAYLSQLPEEERVQVMTENRVKLPNEKKFKIQKESSENLKSQSAAEKEQSAVFCYQLDRSAALKEKHPDKSQAEIIRMINQEWNSLSDKKKAKFYKMAETVGPVVPSYNASPTKKSQTSKPAKKVPVLPSEISKNEPKKPPKTAYALFTSELLSSLRDIEPRRRMQEIARRWKEDVTDREKKIYDEKCKELAEKYQKELESFIKTLTPEQKLRYIESQKGKPPSKKSKKTISSPKVTEKESPIGISTLQYQADDSDNEQDENYGTPEGNDNGSSSENEEVKDNKDSGTSDEESDSEDNDSD